MNLLLLDADELDPEGRCRLTGRRRAHAEEVLGVAAGDRLRVGVVGGAVGEGRVISLDSEALTLEVSLDAAPPPRPGIDLLLALPRPKALKRILPVLSQLGVDRVVLCNAARVEKSYFSSPTLTAEVVRQTLLEGLEQARDTVLPEVLIRERFRPFVEDELDGLFPGPGRRLLLHPAAPRPLPARPALGRTLLAVGPEGGWVPFEVELLGRLGFESVSLGPRILRTETLIPYLLGACRGEPS